MISNTSLLSNVDSIIYHVNDAICIFFFHFNSHHCFFLIHNHSFKAISLSPKQSIWLHYFSSTNVSFNPSFTIEKSINILFFSSKIIIIMHLFWLFECMYASMVHHKTTPQQHSPITIIYTLKQQPFSMLQNNNVDAFSEHLIWSLCFVNSNY